MRAALAFTALAIPDVLMKFVHDDRNGIPAMLKSAASAAAQAGVLVVVISVGAIALRLYSLAYLVAERIRSGTALR